MMVFSRFVVLKLSRLLLIVVVKIIKVNFLFCGRVIVICIVFELLDLVMWERFYKNMFFMFINIMILLVMYC